MSEAVLVRDATGAVPDQRQVVVPAPVRFEGYVRRTLVTTYTDWWRRKWNAETAMAALRSSSLLADHEEEQP